jgi:hypothetical protein
VLFDRKTDSFTRSQQLKEEVTAVTAQRFASRHAKGTSKARSGILGDVINFRAACMVRREVEADEPRAVRRSRHLDAR